MNLFDSLFHLARKGLFVVVPSTIRNFLSFFMQIILLLSYSLMASPSRPQSDNTIPCVFPIIQYLDSEL